MIILQANEIKELNVALIPTVGRDRKLRVYDITYPVFVGDTFRFYFMLIDDTGNLVTLPTPILMTCHITLPDGSVVTKTETAKGINIGVESIFYRTTQLGQHYADFEGYKFSFQTVPGVTQNIFIPTGINLLWNCQPYSKESLDKFESFLDSAEKSNLKWLTVAHFELENYDFKISPILADIETAERFDLVIRGTIKDTYSGIGPGPTRAVGPGPTRAGGTVSGYIGWQVRLVPQYLYLQGFTDPNWSPKGYYYDRRKYTQLWHYPDPNNETIISNSLPRYDTRDDGRIKTIQPFEYRRAEKWQSTRYVRPHWWSPPVLAPVKEVAIPGIRYEVLLYINAVLPPTLSGYASAVYDIRRYHLGYLIMT